MIKIANIQFIIHNNQTYMQLNIAAKYYAMNFMPSVITIVIPLYSNKKLQTMDEHCIHRPIGLYSIVLKISLCNLTPHNKYINSDALHLLMHSFSTISFGIYITVKPRKRVR